MLVSIQHWDISLRAPSNRPRRELREGSLAVEGELLALDMGVEHDTSGNPAATGSSGKTAAVDVMPTRALVILERDTGAD